MALAKLPSKASGAPIRSSVGLVVMGTMGGGGIGGRTKSWPGWATGVEEGGVGMQEMDREWERVVVRSATSSEGGLRLRSLSELSVSTSEGFDESSLSGGVRHLSPQMLGLWWGGGRDMVEDYYNGSLEGGV